MHLTFEDLSGLSLPRAPTADADTGDGTRARPHHRRLLRRTLKIGLVALLAALAAFGITAWRAGYRIYVVHTGSMTPTAKPGDAFLDRPAPKSVQPGEIVTFAVHSGPDSVVTHRVATVTASGIKTKGDANRSVDPWTLRESTIVGAAAAILPKAGYVLVYLQQPQGIASVITVVLGLVLLWQLFFPATSLEPSRSGSAGRHRRPGTDPVDAPPPTPST